MNNFPIPTDNLYKFCALVGVVATFTIGFVLPYTLGEKLNNNIIEAEYQKQIVEVRINSLTQFTDSVLDIVKNLENQKKVKDGFSKYYTEQDIRDLLEKMWARNTECVELNAKLKSLNTQSRRLIQLYEFYKFLMATAFPIMCIIAFWGFYRWKRLQDLQDSILQKQAESIGIEIKLKKKAAKPKPFKS